MSVPSAIVVDRGPLGAPVPGAEPSGPWLRRDPLYAQIQEAVRSDPGDPAYGIPEKSAEWDDACRLCLDALSSRTKDFYLATILLEALVRTNGPRGLADALWFIATLHADFWPDFHPRPRDEGTNFDGRLNQLDAMVRALPRVLDALPMGDASPLLTWGDWRHAGRTLPTGAPSPVSVDETRQFAASSSWDFYDEAARAVREAVAEFARLDDLLDTTYPTAPSLSEAKGRLVELADAFDGLLQAKGPGPHRVAAQQLLAQTGCAFLDETWLAEHMRRGVSLPRALNSVAAACADERAGGLTPEQGWTALLDEHWARNESYERRSAATAEPESHAGNAPDTNADASGAGATSAGGLGAGATGAGGLGAGAGGGGSAPVRGAAVTPIASSGDALGALLGACRALRRSDPSQAIAFVAPRQLRWLDLLRVEPGDGLPGPGDGLRRTLAALFDGQSWAELLEACEQALEHPSTAAWLDLQRYACAAMRQIGLPHADRPRQAVLVALGDMLQRRRWLLDARLGDGGPAADEITRNWIAAEVLVGDDARAGPSGAGPASGPPGGAAATDGSATLLARADELFVAEGVEAAVAFLQDAQHESRAGRQRAVLSLGCADLLLRAGHADLAVPILENLRETLKEAQAPARWEDPDFLARTLEALYHGYSSATGMDAGDLQTRKHSVANELARIDLKRRLKLDAR